MERGFSIELLPRAEAACAHCQQAVVTYHGPYPDACPSCGTPIFIAGKGSQITGRLIKHGEWKDDPPGLSGAVTRCWCLVCRHEWDTAFPDGTIPMA
jgi:hypothetical protein